MLANGVVFMCFMLVAVRGGTGMVRGGTGMVRAWYGMVRDGTGMVRDGTGMVRDGTEMVRDGTEMVRAWYGVVRGLGAFKIKKFLCIFLTGLYCLIKNMLLIIKSSRLK